MSLNMTAEPIAHTRNANRSRSVLNSWQVNFARTEGYDRAEVTLGGIVDRRAFVATQWNQKRFRDFILSARSST